jgi:hypothetical protein
VIYHCRNVPYPQWAEVLPAFTAHAIEAAAHADAPLVVADNLYMCAPPTGRWPRRRPASRL